MHWLRRIATSFMVSAVVSVTLSPVAWATTPQVASVLVFTKAQPSESAHAVTSEAVNLVEMTAHRYAFAVEATDDAGAFTTENLQKYDVVLWLNTTGNVLNHTQRTAFIEWVDGGGGFVGVHAAALAHTGWDQYRELVGPNVISDEAAPTSEEDVSVDTRHPAANEVSPTIESLSDQWYSFEENPEEQGDTTVLATVDGGNHDGKPVVWCRSYGEGRSWYTSMGHSLSTFEEGDYMDLLRGGIWWTANLQEDQKVSTSSAAPQWPYMASFLALIASVAAGGAVAVVRLNRSDIWR